jgi:hypothetical protein
MSKMGLHDPFGHLKHKLWPKERSGVKLAIWLLTTKSQESFDFLACKWRATYHWKTFDKSYNFTLDLTSIRGFHANLCTSKVMGVLILGISKLPLGNPGTKCHLGAGLLAKHIVYFYKEEGGGFPQVRAVVSLVSLCFHVVRSCTKSVETMH